MTTFLMYGRKQADEIELPFVEGKLADIKKFTEEWHVSERIVAKAFARLK